MQAVTIKTELSLLFSDKSHLQHTIKEAQTRKATNTQSKELHKSQLSLLQKKFFNLMNPVPNKITIDKAHA